MANKQMDVDPCHTHIQGAIKDGRCNLQHMSIKQIVRDRRLQAREQECNSPDHLTHAAALSEQMVAMGPESDLAPIVVFLVGDTYYVADGFHRLTAYDKLRRSSIPSYVVSGTWSDAIRFAAMANQRNTMKPRSREDIRKAIRILIEDEECRRLSDPAIAKHVGCSLGVVTKMRLAIRDDRGIPIPSVVIGVDGREYSAKRMRDRAPGSIGAVVSRNRHGREVERFTACIGGKSYQSSNKKLLEDRIEQIKFASDRKAAYLGSSKNLVDYLAARGILARPVRFDGVQGCWQPGCYAAGNYIFVRMANWDVVSFFRAIGSLMLAAFRDGRERRPVVLCDPSSGVEPMVALANECHKIEFMTADGLVDRIKSEEATSPC